MAGRMFIKADEAAEVLEVSKAYAYKLIQRMNKELKAKGYLVIPGRVDRTYFYESFYVNKAEGGKEEANAGL